MKIGICTDYENLNLLKEIGYDYLEGSVVKTVSMSDEEFWQLADNVRQCSIKCEVCNFFFPSTMKLTGPDVNEKSIDEYLKKGFERLSKLGTKLVVVGSGKSRMIPENWCREKGVEQFIRVMMKIGQEGEKYGIVATVEHLPNTSTNIINSIKEGMEFIKITNHPNVKMMVDYGHLKTMKENINILVEARNELMHVHIRNSNNNSFPIDQNEDDYLEFFKILKQIEYKGRISIEAATSNLAEDAANSLKLLRELSDQV